MVAHLSPRNDIQVQRYLALSGVWPGDGKGMTRFSFMLKRLIVVWRGTKKELPLLPRIDGQLTDLKGPHSHTTQEAPLLLYLVPYLTSYFFDFVFSSLLITPSQFIVNNIN